MDIEKTMQFIVEQQAHLTAKLGSLAESVKKHDEQIAKHDQQITVVTDLVGRLAQAGIELSARMGQLIESQAHTDQRLDALIDIIDKLGRRDGGASKS